MKGKSKLIADKIATVVMGWPSVDSILMENLLSGDVYDPYYFLSLDVYYSDAIPPPEERREALLFGAAFETSRVKGKDRLIVDEVPVRIEYKATGRINDIIEKNDPAFLRSAGTYVLYRIINADVCYDRSGWILKMRKKLGTMPQSFWDRVRDVFQSRMEHCLSDLGAASMRNDELFFHISIANFLQGVCSVLFAINRRFEPSFRLFSGQVKSLPTLPESFAALFDSLLRSNSDFSYSQKYKIAELLTKSTLNL
ncbi:MAG: DUF4037 domain-containing protein [Spirochaetia bacterium]|jgi:hypothetical protein|nr:DUF4037 domain-containing protein [Spirochaetia bacterium]